MQRWAKFVCRHSLLWLIAWPVCAVAVLATAPRLETLLKDDATGSLPSDMPSQKAKALLKKEFPAAAPASRAVIVCTRETGLTDGDLSTIDELARTLVAQSAAFDWHVHAVATNPFLRPVLQSSDGKAAVIAVDLSAGLMTHHTVHRVREIRRMVDEQAATGETSAESALAFHVTGNAAIGELLDRSAKRDINMTTMWAFVGVAFILLLIYRSPVAMLLPIGSIALSLMLAVGLLRWAAAIFLPVTGLVEMLIVVILVGSGVDYCLFLFARFREEMSRHPDVRAAVETAVSRSGGAILASAGTNAAALATLALAGNRDLYTSGPTIAIAICVVTFAVLSLTPALMLRVGRFLFWPIAMKKGDHGDGKIWSRLATLVTQRPIATVAVTMLLLVPTAILGTRVNTLYDAYEEFPAESAFVRGARLYQEHFFQAKGVSEMTLILSADAPFDPDKHGPAVAATLDAIAQSLHDRFPLLYQRDLIDPLGTLRDRDEPSNDLFAGGPLAAATSRIASGYFVGGSDRALRIDVGLSVEARSDRAMDMLPAIHRTVADAVADSGLARAIGASALTLALTGETPLYGDMRELRTRDFRVVAVAAIAVVFAILLWLIRSPFQSVILVGATVLTFFATYGATWLIVNAAYGLDGVSWQVHFLLFVIILSLGQDYNIFVVTRIHEELARCGTTEAVATAVRKTGRVVSSCGLIMAATFASLLSASLVLMKEFAVAFALGILIDTFVVRPLLVPALILLLVRRQRPESTLT